MSRGKKNGGKRTVCASSLRGQHFALSHALSPVSRTLLRILPLTLCKTACDIVNWKFISTNQIAGFSLEIIIYIPNRDSHKLMS